MRRVQQTQYGFTDIKRAAFKETSLSFICLSEELGCQQAF
jgi:hypothetical protein